MMELDILHYESDDLDTDCDSSEDWQLRDADRMRKYIHETEAGSSVVRLLPAAAINFLPGEFCVSRTNPQAFQSVLAFILDHRRQHRALIDGNSIEFETIDEKFEALADTWKKFITARSVVEYNHAAYMQIVGMGTAIVPSLLKRLEQGDSDWIVALKYITGEKVTTPAMRGDLSAIRAAWLQWGLENGFRQQLRR